MAGLRELKNRLSSINTVGQLAGAMRTVSAAKYSRVSSVRTGFAPYAESCGQMLRQFGPALAEAIPCGDPSAPACYVVMAGNRGLCGGYNVELTGFAVELLKNLTEPFRLIAVGPKADSALRDGGLMPDKVFSLPDVPDHEACGELCRYLREAYIGGEISGVNMVFQEFVNMLTRKTAVRQILPLASEDAKAFEEPLFLPDKATVLNRVAVSCVDAEIFSCVLSASAAAQAATLVAMRSAYDNAQESIASLETQISRKRQSEVTNSVLETASGNTY